MVEKLQGKRKRGTTGRYSISYDNQGRVDTITETISGNVFSTTFTFADKGRLSTKKHPSGIVETLGYNNYGYMATISADNAVRYTITGRNAREQLTAAKYGNSLTATYGYDAYGYPSSTKTGSVQDYRYVFNPVTGNLTSRLNALRGLSESFAYDEDNKGLDRLTSVTGPQNLTMTYADNGNINTKSDIDATNAFSYGLNAGPYALTGVTSSTNVIPGVSQTITYNSFEKVTSISEANGSQTINASFTYNSDNQRAKMTVGVYYGAEILTRYYVGESYMKEVQPITTNEYTYLGGDAYTAPVVVHNARGVVSYYYLLRDHLGNITHQVNTSNAVVAEYSFDAWGRRRNASNWTYTLDANDKALFADRGFTGHEYLSWYKLYNMNGRLYDPAVGRFLSADPIVQDPGNSQSFNRYSYCLNNPLKFADPSGYIFEQKDMPQDSEHSAAAGDFYRKFTGLSSENGGISGWYTAYRQALNKGYTDGLVKFMSFYDSQVFSPNFNGKITINIEAGRELVWTKKNGEPYLKGVNIYYSNYTIKTFEGGLKTTLNNINDAFNAFGIAAGGAEIFTKVNAGARIYYTSINGTSAWVSSTKVLKWFKSFGNTAFGASIVVDMALTATSNQSLTKTIVNTGVGLGCLKLGGWPGFLIGIGYTTIDKTIGWDKVLTPTTNQPGTFYDPYGNILVR